MTALHKILVGHNSKAVDFFVKELYSQAKVEYSRVIELAPSIINLAKELNKPEIQASTLGDLGAAYAFLRENKKAIETLQEAARMARDLKATDKGAKIIGIDFILDRYQPDNDKILAQAVKKGVSTSPNPTWFIFAGTEFDAGVWQTVIPEIGSSNWSLDGEIEILFCDKIQRIPCYMTLTF
jgi:tetratricopeptide (TPR) repeat protein